MVEVRNVVNIPVTILHLRKISGKVSLQFYDAEIFPSYKKNTAAR
jgi:hypothetical protein